METSILNTTKKILGIAADYTVFDVDIITHINAAFGVLYQLGVGPTDGFSINDEQAVWDDLALPFDQTNMIRTYIFLKVKFWFDPPTTSYMLDAMKQQIEQLEWRLNVSREYALYPLDILRPPEEV